MSIGNEDLAPLRPPETAEARRGNLESLSRKKKGENKNRFSEKQVKMLEGIFETETRIEAVKKVQLARELGLEPRQVAIWFQNRRARWKSKQLEKEYRVLVANYENLASLVGSLKEENHSLHAQVQSLSLGMEKPGQSGGNESENVQRGANRGLKVPEMRWEVVQEFVRMDEVGESCQASTDKERCGADQPCGAEQWWDLWSC